MIVVPKAINPQEVPDKFRVGVPCQKRFGQTPPRPVWEYHPLYEVHLLGGSPLAQTEMMQKIGREKVKSLDTASPIAAASRGDVWGRPFKETEWYESPTRSYYQRIEKSLYNLLTHHNENVNHERIEEIHDRVEIPDEPTTDPVNYLFELPPSREEMCLSTEEEVPFPGRAYFYRDDTLSYRKWQKKYREEDPADWRKYD